MPSPGRSPLATIVAARRGTGIAVGERPPAPILHLERPLGGAASALGLGALPAPGRAARAGDAAMLPVGPETFLLVGGNAGEAALARVFAVVLDMTDAWTRLAIAGPNAKALLAKGCALDFHDQHFPVDACAVAGFARLRAVIWRTDDLSYDLFVGRSHALSLWEWLMDAAAEYGSGGDNAGGKS